MKPHHFLVGLALIVFAYLAYNRYHDQINAMLTSTRTGAISNNPGTGKQGG